MRPLIAVAVERAGADGAVADIIARDDTGVAVGAVMRGEHVHDVIDSRVDGGAAKLVREAPVIREAGIFRENGDLALVGVLIGAEGGDVDCEQILNSIGKHARAVADLLIRREIGVYLTTEIYSVVLYVFHGSEEHRDAGLVVYEAGLDIAVHHLKAGIERDHVAGLDPERADVLGGFYVVIEYDADVRAEIRRGKAKLVLRDVDGVRNAADGTGIYLIVPRLDADVLRHAVEGVEPADGADVQRAVLVDVAHHKADIVKMRRNDECVPLAAHVRDDSALVRDLIGIAELVENIAGELLYLLVLSCGGVDRKQPLENVDAVFFIKIVHIFNPFGI